jgi:hypothetical protein
MKRSEEIANAASNAQVSLADFINGANWADNTMIKKACMCYCDNICPIGMSNMCFHKHDYKGQIKNTFKYNECNELKIFIREMSD